MKKYFYITLYYFSHNSVLQIIIYTLFLNWGYTLIRKKIYMKQKNIDKLLVALSYMHL
jgi:hypothetical protein